MVDMVASGPRAMQFAKGGPLGDVVHSQEPRRVVVGKMQDDQEWHTVWMNDMHSLFWSAVPFQAFRALEDLCTWSSDVWCWARPFVNSCRFMTLSASFFSKVPEVTAEPTVLFAQPILRVEDYSIFLTRCVKTLSFLEVWW